MPKSRDYHEDAILYNEELAEAAEKVAEKIKNPEIKKWPIAVGKQHRFHAKRHRSALNKLDSGEPGAPVEFIPDGLDVPEESLSIADQQARFAAEMEQAENSANFHDAKTGQFVSEEYAAEHPDTTVLVREKDSDEPREVVPVQNVMENDIHG